jgi:two-component system chemotaxis response regulator CheB
MAGQRIVVIGASSGGIEALRELVGGLRPDFPAPICVVLHTSPDSPGLLGKILGEAGVLPSTTAVSGMELEAGHIYVAPSDHHLLIETGGLLRLGRGPKENRFRPAIDPLFRSAAQVYGPAAIGVVLTGNLDDGAAGLKTIKRFGGIAIVQDPHDALYPAMPANALRHLAADYVVPLSDMARVLHEAASSPVGSVRDEADDAINMEVAIAGEDTSVDRRVQHIGDPSIFTCPECHGVLLELKERGILRFRCHTGHAYSADSLLGALNEGIENALWSALRAVEEGQFLLERMAGHTSDADARHAARLRTQLARVTDQAELLREIVGQRVALVPTEE